MGKLVWGKKAMEIINKKRDERGIIQNNELPVLDLKEDDWFPGKENLMKFLDCKSILLGRRLISEDVPEEGIMGEIKCPFCNEGSIKYHQSSYNGHVGIYSECECLEGEYQE